MIIVPTNLGALAPVTIRSLQHYNYASGLTVEAKTNDVVLYHTLSYSDPGTPSGWDRSFYSDQSDRKIFVFTKRITSDQSVTIPSGYTGDHCTVAVLSNVRSSGSIIGGTGTLRVPWSGWTIGYCWSPVITNIVKTTGTSLFLYGSWLYNPAGGNPNDAGGWSSQLTMDPVDTWNGGTNGNYRCFRTDSPTTAGSNLYIAVANNTYGGLGMYISWGFEIVGN